MSCFTTLMTNEYWSHKKGVAFGSWLHVNDKCKSTASSHKMHLLLLLFFFLLIKSTFHFIPLLNESENHYKRCLLLIMECGLSAVWPIGSTSSSLWDWQIIFMFDSRWLKWKPDMMKKKKKYPACISIVWISSVSSLHPEGGAGEKRLNSERYNVVRWRHVLFWIW